MVAFVFLVLGEDLAGPVCYDIELASYDGFYFQRAILVLMFVGLRYEFEGAEHVAVVGNGQCRHAIFDRFFIEALDGGGAVQKGELGMGM